MILRSNAVDDVVKRVLSSTPLFFIQDFLRAQRKQTRGVRIGTTRTEAEASLRDALLSKRIGLEDVEAWLEISAGWGKQHLYIMTVQKRSLTHPHLLSTAALSAFLKRKRLLEEPTGAEPSTAHVLDAVDVDDELVRISWRSHSIKLERHEELDRTEEQDDGTCEFHAYRRIPQTNASRLLIRKTNGLVLLLVDLPLGPEHDAMRKRIDEMVATLLTPLSPKILFLAGVVTALDQGAVAARGPRPERALAMAVSPTKARYATDGARLEFESSRASAGYTESEPVRRVRNALKVEQFVGEAGKFRLSFESEFSRQHDVIVSMHASDNRVYLFSRMDETEVLSLVDQIVSL